MIHATRKELWGFVGFKHVNGPQAWDSIAKAEYVFRVRRNFGLSLAEIASGTLAIVLLALPVLSARRVRDIPTGVHTFACTDRPREDA